MPIIDACPVALDPFPHQLERWRLHRERKGWATFWEQGTGKSCRTIMEAAWLYTHGEIDAILVLAPNGVHTNWVTDEMPTHWPKELGTPAMCAMRSKLLGRKYHQADIQDCIDAPGLAVLAASYDALDTDDKEPKPGIRLHRELGGKSWIKKFLTERKVLFVADESTRIKTPNVRRTVLTCKAAMLAPYRRVLNGTPVPNGPFDIYSQICMLDPIVTGKSNLQGRFWMSKGITSFEGFKTQFGVFEASGAWVKGKNGDPYFRHFKQCVGYKNLELLNKWLLEISDRVLKEDVLPNLPAKLYKTLTFDLSPAQRKVYNALRDEAMAFLESGALVTTSMALVKMLRLQQVCNGYVSIDDAVEEPIQSIGKDNPRLDLLMEICEDLPHKAIIWTRFRRDGDMICEALTKKKCTHTRYDGSVDDEGREAAKAAFKNDEAQFFVSNPAAGGEGLTLLGDQSEGAAEGLACKTVIYYGNSFNLQHRLQSEDRCHRIGQRWAVQYIDLVASDTIDEYTVEKLKEKFDIAQQVTGDRLSEWLS